jgi:hypothetical protein
MFDAVDNYMRGTLLGSFVADRQGKLWAEVGAWAYANPTGSFLPIQSLEKRDWLGEPSLEERFTPPVSFLELGGVAYSGSSTGTFSAFISNAPGSVPNTRGNVDTRQGLALGSQAQLNTLTGNIFANENSRYPNIELDLAGNYRQLDIAPQVTLDVDIAPADTTRNISLHAPYLVESLQWGYDSRSKVMLPQAGLISVINGIDGETITIPDVPDGGGYGGFAGGFNFNPSLGLGFPPFFSTLSNLSIWKGEGTFATDGAFDSPILLDTLVFNYGTDISPGTPSSFPTILSAGVYCINLNFTVTNTDDQQLNIRIKNGSSTLRILYYLVPLIPTNFTISYTEYFYFAAGSVLAVLTGAAVAGSAGTFNSTIQKVFVE